MINVCAVSATQRRTALELLFSHLPAEERSSHASEVLESAALGELNLDGLLVAEVNGAPMGAGLFVLQPDQTASVWPPFARPSATADEVTDAILQEMCRRIGRSGARIAQCLLEPDTTDARDALSRIGFEHLTDLTFMQRWLDAPLPSPDVQFETIDFDEGTNHDRFANILERTLLGTLDCPEVNGLRTGAQALAGHRSVGEFRPSLWKISRVQGVDVGLLLMTEHSGQDAWEVVYMGLIPEARGRGYGRGMLLTGLHQAHDAGVESVQLAVDCRNLYAKRIYEELGFQDVAVRRVHIRMFVPPRFGQ